MQFLPDQVHAEFFQHYFSMFEFHIVDEDNATLHDTLSYIQANLIPVL